MSTPKRTGRARARARDAWSTGWIHGRVMGGFVHDFATLRAWWQASIAFNLHHMHARDAALVAGLTFVSACGGSTRGGRHGVSDLGGDHGPRSEHVGDARLLRRDVERAVASEKDALAAIDRELTALDGRESSDEATTLR